MQHVQEGQREEHNVQKARTRWQLVADERVLRGAAGRAPVLSADRQPHTLVRVRLPAPPVRTCHCKQQGTT